MEKKRNEKKLATNTLAHTHKGAQNETNENENGFKEFVLKQGK